MPWKGALLLALSWPAIAPAALAATPVSVADLNQLLHSSTHQPDGQLARKLSELELTQRLNSAELSNWLQALPGQKTQHALLALADKAAFEDPPPQEIPPLPAPSAKAQQHMLALSLDYINKTIHQLPNLFATRVTSSYQETLWEHWQPDSGFIRFEPLHFVRQFTSDVQYRNGGEEAHSDQPRQSSGPVGLQTSGEFGLLGTVLEDAVQNKLSWSRWEQGNNGPLAVYRYTVPAEKSHYRVGSSWMQNVDGAKRVVYQQFSGYRGEIAIDPATGTILRLMLLADAKPADRLAQANILVEYGPVVLDGKSYVCPLRSVALSLAADVQVYSAQNRPAPRFLQTSLNNVVFERYHLFHADARILTAAPENP